MQKREYDVMSVLEEKLFWFQLKSELIKRLITRFLNKSKGIWLDIGCGTGGLTHAVEKNSLYDVVGMDSNRWAVDYSSKHLSRLIKGSASSLPFKNDSVQVVSFFDVLYHRNVESERISLDEAYRVLDLGGWLFITDSAYSFLIGKHDQFVEGARRFTVKQMKQTLRESGFVVMWSSYFFSWLLPIVVIKRLLLDRVVDIHHSDVIEIPEWANMWGGWIGRIELGLMRLMGSLPFGLSLIVVARKK